MPGPEQPQARELQPEPGLEQVREEMLLSVREPVPLWVREPVPLRVREPVALRVREPVALRSPVQRELPGRARRHLCPAG